ncbi:hypothetical protein ACX6XY_06050 [Streptomyces sp. O3]
MAGQWGVRVEAQAMAGFRKRVGTLLAELSGSDADAGRMSDGVRMTRGQLGSREFREAQFLYETFAVVHAELVKLSKALDAQIEGVGLAVHASQKGYHGIDQSTRDRVRAVNAEAERQVDQYRAPSRAPYAGYCARR